MKRSIRTRIQYLLSISLIMLSVIMIAANFIIINETTIKNSEVMMEKSCASLAMELNNQFELVEQSVRNLYDLSEKFRPSIDKLGDEDFALRYIEEFKNAAITIAENTEGALAIYYRMNPDITLSGTTGFFYVKSNETGRFEANEITDLYDYDVNDMEHVGWYYVPVWAGEPVWMEPYYNANIDVEMISYVVPIYDGNSLVGVVGIDVDFNAIKSIAENINIYQSSGAVLCSMTNSTVYYNKCDLFGDTIPSDVYAMLQSADSSEGIISYKMNNTKYGMYYMTLHNRMKLLIYAKQDEMFSRGRSAIFISLVVFAVIFIITLIISLKMSKRIVDPIIEITEATKKYALGNWDVKVHCDTQDEIQLLSENITIMADKTNEYIKYIQDMAKKDGLTGLRNKTDYILYVELINTDYIPNQKDFAVAVFDVNNLKTVNDNFGHEKGDELIVSASQLICKYFSHSPVFRVGGDEFVAIIDGADFENRKSIEEDFHKYMSLSRNSDDIMDVCIACGVATIREDGESFDDVFDSADRRMYKNKAELKNRATIR